MSLLNVVIFLGATFIFVYYKVKSTLRSPRQMGESLSILQIEEPYRGWNIPKESKDERYCSINMDDPDCHN